MNIKTIGFWVALFFIGSVFSQDANFSVNLNLTNISKASNDVHAKAIVKGGQAPYLYLWNSSNISIYASEADGLSEGESISILVIDSNQDSVWAEASIKAESFEEHISEIMNPAVNFLDKLLFGKIWSDTIRVQDYALKAPFALEKTKENYVLKEWLRKDGEQVKHLEPIAILKDGEKEFPLYAIGNGVLSYGTFQEKKVEAGDPVFYMNDRGHRAEKTLAQIHYASPQPMYQHNLSTKTQGIPLIVAWLVLGALFFTFKLGFLQFRWSAIKHSLDLIRGRYDNPEHNDGEVSHFQALVTALSATIGLGNIAGVAIAIGLGGPGATFWMILAGLLGMAVKFAEATLGVKYRVIRENGEVSGGPMYYLSRGLAKRGSALKSLGKILALAFAILAVIGSFGIGNMFQANQAFNQLKGMPGWENFGEYGFYFGLGLAVLVGMVIVGGIKSIAKVTDKVVPFMVVIYVLSALAIIGINFNNIGYAFSAIFQGAFQSNAMYGGIIGVLIVGFQRAAFSNESGIGSSPIAHAAAKTEHPVSEGIVALLEPFLDTVVVCTMTALVIIFSGYALDSEGLVGSALTSAAFSSSLGGWSIYILSFSVFLFAFSTMISWSYYGLKAFTFLFGENKYTKLIYNTVFLVFIVVGTSIGLGAVLDFSDLLILAMAFPNILGLIIMSGEIKRDKKEYFKKVKMGEIQKFK